MRLRFFQIVLLTAGAVSLSPCQTPGADQVGRPNVLIVTIDTLRPDHLGCYGYTRATSPNIDRLAAHGQRFERAFTTMPTTLPAHSSLFTSLYPTQHSTRRNGENLPTAVTTLAEQLLASGYRTAAFVSATVLDSRHGLMQGFESFSDVGEARHFPAEATLAKARKWLGAHDKSEPFFLFVHFYDPHAPYEAPPKYCRQMQAPNEPMPRGWKLALDPEQMKAEHVAEAIAAYDAEIAYSDWAVGELMAELEKRGLDERTLVVLTADHGETLTELYPRFDYAFRHGQFLYTHQIRIPLIFRMPGFPARKDGGVHAQPVSIVDVAPTILEILAIDPAEGIEGRSLVTLLDGKSLPDRPLFAERRFYDDPPPEPYLAGRDYTVVDGTWQFIRSVARPGEFYNIAEDPSGARDLGTAHERAKALEQTLNEWLERLAPRFGAPEFDSDPETLERLRSLGYVK